MPARMWQTTKPSGSNWIDAGEAKKEARHQRGTAECVEDEGVEEKKTPVKVFSTSPAFEQPDSEDKEEEAAVSWRPDGEGGEASTSSTAGGRGSGTMATLIKRFRESPPLPKAERTRDETSSSGLDARKGFWWRDESKRHIDRGVELDETGLFLPAVAPHLEAEEEQGGADEELQATEREGLLRDLHTMFEVAEGEDILQAWRKQNRMLLKKRGLLQQQSLLDSQEDDDEGGDRADEEQEDVIGEDGAQTLEEHVAEDDEAQLVEPVARGQIMREGGYRSFIEKLRTRLGMFESPLPASDTVTLVDFQVTPDEEDQDEEEDESEAPEEEAAEEEEEEEAAPPLAPVAPIRAPVNIEPLLDQVVHEQLFVEKDPDPSPMAAPPASPPPPRVDSGDLPGEEGEGLNPQRLLEVTKYDSDKVVLMLKEKILEIQNRMDKAATM